MEHENVDAALRVKGKSPVAGRLSAGAQLARGRYQIVGLIGQSVFGEIYRATDAQGHQPVALRVLSPQVASAESLPSLEQEMRRAAAIDHKNVARVHGAFEEAGMICVVSDFVDGQSLRELVDRKRESGVGAFSFKGAYNIIAHVCNGLSQIHKTTLHGALSPVNVLVNKAGRVKITELGLARALPGFARTGGLTYVAPEMATMPQKADRRADLYSVGALLFELLTGHPPSESFVAPSSLVPGLGAEVDQLLMRCLAPNPGDRPVEAAQLKGALQMLVDKKGKAATTIPPKTTARPASVAAASARASAPRPAQAPGPRPPAASGPSPRPSAPSGMAVDEHLEKWLVQKDKLDYGPFSLAQLKQQIMKDEFVAGNVMIDNETGERTKIENHPLLSDLVAEAARRRDERRRAEAEASVVKQEKRRGSALFVLIGVGGVALLVGGYFVVRALSSAERTDATQELASLEAARLEVTIQFKPQAKGDGKKRRGGKRRGPSGSTGAAGGWDDTLDMGDVSDGDEEWERLSNAQLNSVIQGHGNALGRCLLSTGERNAYVEFIVKGNGKVSSVRVNGQTGSKVANCVRGVMNKMQFPTFNGPRTKGEFDMNL